MASKDIQIKGSFDASQILASFRKIRDEAAKSNVSDKLLGGYDKELEKVEKLTTQILAAQSRGLTDNQSIKEFARLVSQLEKQYGILNVKAQAFTDAANYKTETAEIKQYSTQLKTLIERQKSLEKSAKDYIDANSDSLKLTKEESKALKQSISDAQAYKEVLDEIVEKRIEAAKQKVTKLSLDATGGQQKYADITSQNRDFTVSAAARKANDPSRQSAVNKKGQFDENFAVQKANEEYNRILEKTIKEGKDAETAIQDLIKVMKAYRVELGDTDKIQEQFANDIKEIREAALADYSNLSGSAKGKFTLANNNQDRIRNSAQDLYNNNDVGKAEQNLSNISNLQDTINKKTEEYNGLIEQSAKDQEQLTNKTKESTETAINSLKAERDEGQKYVELQNNIKSGFESIGRGAKQIISVTTAWRSLRNVIKSTFNDVKALDKSFASIAMVTSYSVKDMWAQYDQYAEMANRLGQSTQSVVEASGLYYQQGLKTNEVLKLTEETMKLATLAGLDFKEATSQMTAALRAFHMDMDEGAHVTDVYAEVAAHAAVDVQGLSEAMSACAAIANSAGMSFENTTAMLATMVEATQEAPKNLGTAMKTILARFTELKTNVAGTAESEFDDLDYNKVDKALKSVGISIKDATGQFRNMDDVLLELSSKWNSLDRNSQRYIATIAAGSRQQSRFIALMENYERIMELVNVAQNSAGRSSQQFAKYQDTVEYRLNKIKNSWEQFRTSLLDSNVYKGALDLFNGFLDKLNDTSEAGLITLAGTWLTVGRKAISGITSSWSNMFSNALGSNGNGGLAGKILDGALNKKASRIEKNRNNALSEGKIDQAQQFDNQLNEIIENRQTSIKQIGSNIGNILTTGITTAITMGLTVDDPIKAGLAASATSALSLAPTFIQLGQTLGGPMGAAIGAAVSVGIGAISGLISWFRKLKKEQREATPEYQVKKLKKEVEALNEQLDHQKQDLKNSQNEKKNLESILSDYELLRYKVVKTEEEQEKYNNLIKTVTSDYPELISYYDEETQQLKLQTDLIQDKIEKNKVLQKQQADIVAATSLSKLDTQRKLDWNQAQVDFKRQLEKSNYNQLSEDKKIQYALKYPEDNPGGGPSRISKYSTEDISNLASQAGYNTDKMSSLLQEQVKLGLITNEELKSILSITENISGRYNNDKEFDEYQKIALEKINNLEEYKNYSAQDKELLSYQMASHMTDKNQLTAVMNEFDKMLKTGGVDELFKRTKYEDLSAEAINFLDEYQISEDQYTTAIKNEATAKDNLTKLIKNQIAAEQLLQNTQSEKNSASNINNTLKNLKFGNYNEKITSLENIYKDDGTKKYLEKYKEQFDNFKKQLDEIGIKEIDNFQELSNEETEVQSKIISNLTSIFGKTDSLGKAYENLFSSVQKTKIPKEIQNKLLSFNPADLKGQTKEDAKNTLRQLFTDAINSGKITEEAANKTIDAYLTEIEKSGINNFAITNTIGIDTFIEKASKKYKDTVTNYKSAIDTINSNISNGFIDYLDKDKIEEAIKSLNLDPSKYLFTDDNGNYQINVETLNEDVQKQLTDEESITKELQEQVQEGIEQLTQKKNMLNAIINEYKMSDNRLAQERAITKEYALQKSFKDNLNTDKTWAEIATEFDDKWDQSHTMILSQDDIAKMERQIEEIDTQIENLKDKARDPEAIEKLKKERIAAANAIKDIYKTNTKAVEDFKKENDDAYKDWVDKTKAVEEAKKSLAKAIETVKEKQKELADVIKGTDWESSLDGMYNYDTALDSLVKQTERAKKKLDKSMSEDESKRNAELYGQSLLNQKANIGAQRQVYEKAIANYNQTYREKLGPELNKWEEQSKTKFDPSKYVNLNNKTGRYEISMDKLQKDQLPKEVKSWVENYVKTVNDYQGKIEDLRDKEEELDEQYLEWKKQVRDDYINLQQKMMDVLREKYQKEIDDLQNKYDAMEEADQKYLEALQKNIDKQRKLRDQENSWNELADKERKLSLMQRDTSSGNVGEVKSLEKEIKDDRTQLLDTAVDDIIEKLQEFYDLQKESRDTEIEYKETLITDVNLLKEVTEELKKIHTSEDLKNWWKNTATDIIGKSEQELQREEEEWGNLITAKTNYATSVDETFKHSIETAEGGLKDVADETEKVVRTTSEQITALADTTLEKAGKEYSEAIKKAKEALADAVDAVQKQKEALQAAIDAANEAKKAFNIIADKYREVLAQKNKAETKVVYEYNGKYYESQADANKAAELDHKNGHNNTQKTIEQTKEENREAKKDREHYVSADSSAPAAKKRERDFYYINNDKDELFTSSDDADAIISSRQVSNYGKYEGKINKLKIKDRRITVDDHGILVYDDKKEEWKLLQFLKSLKSAENSVEWMEDQGDKRKLLAFAEGGLVNYTGPAWVDGSRSKPEAFLSSEDTRRIGEAARILADLPLLSQPIKEQVPTTTIGDTTIQIDVHVDSIANDYDLDEAMNKVEQRIVNAAKYAGSNVILKKH